MTLETYTSSIGVGLALVLGGGLVVLPGSCVYQTAYSCARVEPDPRRDTGRLLFLDRGTHSYVDLADPTHLEFEYTQWFAAALNAHHPTGSVLGLRSQQMERRR